MSELSPLPPGFMVVHGNHPEHLRDLMIAWMARHPLAPLEDEVVLVQSNGIAQWLKLSLAADPAHGGAGIAAALQTKLPSQGLWEAYRHLLGRDAVPATSALDKSRLVWRLMRLLPARLEEPEFAPLRRFLQRDPDSRKLHQLAMRVADLLDQYQVYRADWLGDWGAGKDVLAGRVKTGALDSRLRGSDGAGEGGNDGVGGDGIPADLRWQPHLWRILLEDVGAEGAASGRAEVHQRFIEKASDPATERPARLPRRITVFGVSSLPQQSLEVLAALARWTQVLLCVHNPCEHDWSHIVADQHLLRAARRRHKRREGTRGEGDELPHLQQAQPLLAAWGRQGRDFIRLLDAHDEREAYERRFTEAGMRTDVFVANEANTLLRQLQDDIRDLRPLAETRAKWPAVDPQRDRSIAFHVTHGPQREVEVLHDQLLKAFADDPKLKPRDVIVMVPDIATYAAHVQAVFGLVDRNDARYIPFNVADQAQRAHDPLLGALEQLLNLPRARLSVSEVLDLLEVPAVRARFGIAEAQLPLLHRWVAAARIRWGLHAEHREALDLPGGLAQNTWAFGLRRMLLGYAVGGGEAWQDIAPMDEIGGLDAALLGPLVRLLDTLDDYWRQLDTPAPAAEWLVRLRAMLGAFFRAEDGSVDGLTLMRLQSELLEWEEACSAADLHEPLPLSVVREHWLSRMEGGGLNQAFFAGGVTFASLMPMRAIPFKWVALLGMNDGDYPRSRVPMDFDLMANDYRPGDRSRREDDRYLFLEALLSAREHLHISWVGRSIHDNEPRPASVLVAQLRDHLAAGWRVAGDVAGEEFNAEDAEVAQKTQKKTKKKKLDAGGHSPQLDFFGDFCAPSASSAFKDVSEALTTIHRLQPFNPAYFDGSNPRLFSYAREWRASVPTGAANDAVEATELPPADGASPLTLQLLGDFLKNPARAFFRQRLQIHFKTDDVVGQDQEPFDLDALENWKLQDELIRAQRVAVDRGAQREPVLQAELDRMALRGDFPLAAFAVRVREALAEPMARLFASYEQACAEWPDLAADEHLHFGFGDEPLLLEDWLGGMRRNAAGQRARLVLASSGLIAQKPSRWRYEQLLPHWLAHLAGQLGGEPLTTIVLSKAGHKTFAPLASEQVEAHWTAVLDAWRTGMRKPLPFAVQSAAVWLNRVPRGADAAAREAAGEAARSRYEDNDPANQRFAESARSPDLARAFPDFESLWAGGAFEECAEALLRPLTEAMGPVPKGDGA